MVRVFGGSVISARNPYRKDSAPIACLDIDKGSRNYRHVRGGDRTVNYVDSCSRAQIRIWWAGPSYCPLRVSVPLWFKWMLNGPLSARVWTTGRQCEVHLAAFPTQLEADLVDLLRANGNAVVSLVAHVGARIAGHVLFSPVIVERNGEVVARGLGLAPLAVMPAQQRQGIGAALVRAGIEECRNKGTPFVVVLGGPEYYRRFGFVRQRLRPRERIRRRGGVPGAGAWRRRTAGRWRAGPVRRRVSRVWLSAKQNKTSGLRRPWFGG